MDRYVISVCGPNGAGKSTLTRSVLLILGLPVIDPDLYSTQGIGEIAAGKLAIRMIDSYLEQGVSFIKESTLTSNFDISRFRQAKNLGYKNILIYLTLPSVEESLQRVARRVKAGGHSIPEETVLRRFDKSLENLGLIKREMDHCFVLDSTLDYPLQEEYRKMDRLLKSIRPRLR